MTWDDYYMGQLCKIAMKSKDRSVKIGAIIVAEAPGYEVRSQGFNGFPRGVNDNIEERYERPEKYYWTEHAERNAIYNAARCGISLNNCTLYVTSLPCTDCARAIIQSGIKRVVYGEISVDIDSSLGKRSIYDKTKQMFSEAAVTYELYGFLKDWRVNTSNV